jgi:hypothetical protein
LRNLNAGEVKRRGGERGRGGVRRRRSWGRRSRWWCMTIITKAPLRDFVK